MKSMPCLCISLAGLLLLSACNDNSGSMPSNAVQSNDMTEIVNRAVTTTPDDTSPIDLENMTVPVSENAEPTML